MTNAKQLINMVGAVAVVAVLALGLLLGALPFYTQSAANDAQTATVAQQNQTQSQQVQQLAGQEDQLPAIQAQVDALTAEVASAPELNEVVRLVVSASLAGIAVRSITPGVAEDFTAPTGPVDDSSAAATQTTTSDTSASDGASASASPGPTVEASASASPVAAAPASNGFQQIPLTIVVEAADMQSAIAFLDGLRAGPRLLANVNSTISDTPAPSSDGMTLTVTVTARAFVAPAQ